MVICLVFDIFVCNEFGVKCNVDCCFLDYCNGVFGYMVSGFFLMVCVFIVIGVIYLFGY